MGVIIYSFNLNMSPKVSHGVLECDIVTELYAYDFVIAEFIIRRGIICARPCGWQDGGEEVTYGLTGKGGTSFPGRM